VPRTPPISVKSVVILGITAPKVLGEFNHEGTK